MYAEYFLFGLAGAALILKEWVEDFGWTLGGVLVAAVFILAGPLAVGVGYLLGRIDPTVRWGFSTRDEYPSLAR